MPSFKVCIIGSGNLAFHLSKNLENAGIDIACIFSRKRANAEKLAKKLYHALPTDDFDLSDVNASIFFLCVSDDAISKLANAFILPENSMLVHCSGSTSLMSIKKEGVETGVFYPLQTFSSERKISFEGVPVCIEASSGMAEGILEKIAKNLKSKPFFMNSEQRLTLHMSAVFACNFTNHLFYIAKLILQDQGLPFSLLHNLVAETVQKAMDKGPENVQTGPAIRNDVRTLAVHESMLGDNPYWQNIYISLSEDIKRINGSKD